jgi:hypothetical protein
MALCWPGQSPPEVGTHPWASIRGCSMNPKKGDGKGEWILCHMETCGRNQCSLAGEQDESQSIAVMSSMFLLIIGCQIRGDHLYLFVFKILRDRVSLCCPGCP